MKPTDDGGSLLEGYVIERREDSGKKGKQFAVVGRYPPEKLQAKFTDLKSKAMYDYRIAAFNKYGVSDWTNLSVQARQEAELPGKPEAPTVAEPSQSRCRLNWAPPPSDGGSQITRYVVQYTENGNNQWQAVPRQPSSTLEPLTLPVSRLKEDVKYQFRVAAVNAIGQGPFSDPSRPVTAKDKFEIPSKLETPEIGDISKGKCRVNWKPPPSDGGSPVTGYMVQKSSPGTNKWETLPKVTSRTSTIPTTLPLSKLPDDTPVQFRVAAENKTGLGPYSSPSEPIIAKDPFEIPGQPAPPLVTDVAKQKCNVTWNSPNYDGGAPISKYHVEKSKTGSNTWERLPPTDNLSTPVVGLDEKGQYRFRVAAENVAGVGPFSHPSDSIKPIDPTSVPGIPGKPALEKITAKSCKFSWMPPTDDGGEPITDYVVEAEPEGEDPYAMLVGGPQPQYVLRNMEPDKPYKIRVRAVNNIGKSDPSQPSDSIVLPSKAEAIPIPPNTHSNVNDKESPKKKIEPAREKKTGKPPPLPQKGKKPPPARPPARPEQKKVERRVKPSVRQEQRKEGQQEKKAAAPVQLKERPILKKQQETSSKPRPQQSTKEPVKRQVEKSPTPVSKSSQPKRSKSPPEVDTVDAGFCGCGPSSPKKSKQQPDTSSKNSHDNQNKLGRNRDHHASDPGTRFRDYPARDNNQPGDRRKKLGNVEEDRWPRNDKGRYGTDEKTQVDNRRNKTPPNRDRRNDYSPRDNRPGNQKRVKFEDSRWPNNEQVRINKSGLQDWGRGERRRRTPPKKNRLDRLNEDKPDFDLYTGMGLNKLNRHDIQRKVTQF